MAQINLTGWRVGLKKVSLTKALQAEFGLSLTDAKGVTDRLLAGEAVSLPAARDEAAGRIAALLTSIGAEVSVQARPVAPKAAG